MASDIDIASNALQLIGDNPINSFSDPGAGARVMSAIFETTLEALLTETYWRFAIKKQELNRLSQTPENDFQYAFQLPTDNLKVLKVEPRTFYQIYRDLIYSNSQTMVIDYVFRPETSLLPSYFVKAFEYKLASDGALAVTDNESKAALMEQKHTIAMGKAFTADAQGNPQVPIQDQPFTDARWSGETF